MFRWQRASTFCRAVAAVLAVAGTVHGEPLDAELARQTKAAVDRAFIFLQATQQADGGWLLQGRSDPAITALVAKCFVQAPQYGPRHATPRRALEFMLHFVQPDGGVYVPGQGLRNYQTSVCLMALAAARDAVHAKNIAAAQAFLKTLQWDEEEGHEATSAWYGGAGYGKHKRPDLSNTQMMLEALRQSGLPPDDPAFQKAMSFIQRCQMLSETNDQPFARGVDDGGFIYTPVGDGESKAGTELTAGRMHLRTYGSMTYAGFKSMLYADVDRHDPRVQRAWDWIRRHYTLDHNPNMPFAQSREGLYYYYHVFAKALDAWGEETLTDAQGVRHHWRAELCRKLIELQREDGSWVNEADRWYEGNPYLVTAYAVLAIQTVLP